MNDVGADTAAEQNIHLKPFLGESMNQYSGIGVRLVISGSLYWNDVFRVRNSQELKFSSVVSQIQYSESGGIRMNYATHC